MPGSFYAPEDYRATHPECLPPHPHRPAHRHKGPVLTQAPPSALDPSQGTLSAARLQGQLYKARTSPADAVTARLQGQLYKATVIRIAT